MMLEIVALAVVALVSIMVPLVVLGIVLKQNKKQWKSIVLSFVCGGLVYGGMQWGIKEHGLTWLFNHTDFKDFLSAHYIPYLLVVALAGALLTVLAQMFVIAVLYRRKLSFGKVVTFSVGYSMVESCLLVGIKSINTIMHMVQGTEMKLDTTAGELFLSGYERILLVVIELAIVVTLAYFMEKRMSVRGGFIAVFCYAMVAFLPGFFLAFTLPDYYEVFDRSIALTMVYVLLTASTLAALVVIKAFKNQLSDSDV